MDDSLKKGYVRYKIGYETGQYEIEFWKTKTDKHPRHYGLKQIREYAIKKDTFKVFHDFQYKDEVKEILEVQVIVRGKLSLYATKDLEYETGYIYTAPSPSAPAGSSMAVRKKVLTYILRDNKGYMQVIDPDYLRRDLSQFIYDNTELMSRIANEKIKYKNLKEITETYNKKENSRAE